MWSIRFILVRCFQLTKNNENAKTFVENGEMQLFAYRQNYIHENHTTTRISEYRIINRSGSRKLCDKDKRHYRPDMVHIAFKCTGDR